MKAETKKTIGLTLVATLGGLTTAEVFVPKTDVFAATADGAANVIDGAGRGLRAVSRFLDRTDSEDDIKDGIRTPQAEITLVWKELPRAGTIYSSKKHAK